MKAQKLSDRFVSVLLTSSQPKQSFSSPKAKAAAVNDLIAKGVTPEVANRVAHAQIELYPEGDIKNIMSPKHAFDTYHRRVTVPYIQGASGAPMLLAIETQEQHSKRFRQCFMDFQQRLLAFVPTYVERLETIAGQLGEYFDPNQYPHPDRITDAFKFKVVYAPLPDVSQFALGAFAEEQAELLKAQYEAELAASAEDATRKYRDRIVKSLNTLSERLRGGKGTRLHESLLTNLQEILDSGLNVTGDAMLDLHLSSSRIATAKIERAMESREPADRTAAADECDALSRKFAMLF